MESFLTKMVIDQRSRDRIIAERQQRGLVSQLVESLKPAPVVDNISEPISKIVAVESQHKNVSTILVAFTQKILSILGDLSKSSPSASDVRDVGRAIKNISFPETEIPDTITLNKSQFKKIISSLDEINQNIKNLSKVSK